jgi:tRNA modification GTPase
MSLISIKRSNCPIDSVIATSQDGVIKKMENSTIAAIATPGGRGGIGIIKISGSKALPIAAAIFDSTPSHPPSIPSKRAGAVNQAPGDGFKSHRLYYGHIVDPGSRQVLDEVLLSVMKAPRSYTREDVVEINAHGGQVAVHAILELVLKQGARLAEPGEFTKRAFLNGRIDLTQAEAVIDIINARTDKSLQVAAAQVNGTLSKPVTEIRQYLIGLLTRAEAGIDFPDDVDEILEPAAVTAELENTVIIPLQRLIQLHDDGNVLRDGLKVAVVGRPNVGKSSLLNCLAKKERVIVTAVPGTTRDTIEEAININGLPIILADTAGLHDTHDPIETMGIEKTIENVNAADLVLLMVEAHRGLSEDDYKIFRRFRAKPIIVVINKIDLVDNGHRVGIPAQWAHCNCVRISALYDRGLETLKAQVVATAFGNTALDIEAGIIPNLRQKLLLDDSLNAALAIRHELNNGQPMELIAIQLQDAVDALGQILGTTVKVDVLDQIFSQFCIGK